ncbi:TPA: cysteine desulfurase NifS [Candidatus Uhrbacteria bacterium]|nr:cysteine desulfurase NifS [Candidatus Uhrbacteria bacterium]HCB55924.1 cysteine desulfurase NifS [Candidatus Uhrbacteria bacterium]
MKIQEKVKKLYFRTQKTNKLFVYLDHAATTSVDLRVQEVMLSFLDQTYGNPSSLYQKGMEAKHALDQAREQIAKILHAKEQEIIFTSGGTESDNLAILGFARANKEKGKHLITTKLEHHAVLEAMMQLEKNEGFEVTFLEPNKQGLITAKQVKEAVRSDTILVSVMYANNEVGTIFPIAEIGNLLQKYRQEHQQSFPVFHTDACQATGYLDLDCEKLHVDLLTINGSKMYGPKGVGVLFVKQGIKLQPLMFGGGQERSLRPGTENVSGIVGLAKALEIAQKERQTESTRQLVLRDFLIERILSTIPKTRLNGHTTERLPNNVNISFEGIEGEALLLYLDHEGIAVSTGSACTSQSLEPSHVLTALGLPHEQAHSSIRFTLGRSTTQKDLEFVLSVLPQVVKKLRSLSPLA